MRRSKMNALTRAIVEKKLEIMTLRLIWSVRGPLIYYINNIPIEYFVGASRWWRRFFILISCERDFDIGGIIQFIQMKLSYTNRTEWLNFNSKKWISIGDQIESIQIRWSSHLNIYTKHASTRELRPNNRVNQKFNYTNDTAITAYGLEPAIYSMCQRRKFVIKDLSLIQDSCSTRDDLSRCGINKIHEIQVKIVAMISRKSFFLFQWIH